MLKFCAVPPTFLVIVVAVVAGFVPFVSADAAGVSKSAFDFNLKDLVGQEHKLSSYKGKVVLVNFWATWCLACKEELPSLAELARKYKNDGLVVISISDEPAMLVASFVQAFGVADDFVFLTDPKRTAFNKYRVVAIPTTYLVGRDGAYDPLTGVFIGARNWQAPDIESRIISALALKGGKP